VADEAVKIDLKAQTSKEVVSLVANTIRNPPTTPMAMVQYAAKNFTASGNIGKVLSGLLPDVVGTALPIVGAIFDLFGDVSGPDIMDAIGEVTQAIEEVSNQIAEEARLIKAEIQDATQLQASRTISLVTQGATELARSESAVRILNTIEELRQNDTLNAIATEIYAEYADDVKRIQEEIQTVVDKAIADAQAEIDKYYAQLQAVLGRDFYDWLKLIYKELTGEEPPRPQVDTRALTEPGAPVPVVATVAAAESAESSSMMPMLLIGGAVLLFVVAQKSKKR